jgi:hypothetical protein
MSSVRNTIPGEIEIHDDYILTSGIYEKIINYFKSISDLNINDFFGTYLD